MDESTLNGIFWHHLIYPELMSHTTGDTAFVAAWVNEHLRHEIWPTYVACIAVEEMLTMSGSELQDSVDHTRREIIDVLTCCQRMLLGFAHGNAHYLCGVNGEDDESLPFILEKMRGRIAQSLRVTVTIGLAYLPDQSVAGLRWAAQRSIVAQRQKVRTSPNQVYFYEESAPAPSLELTRYWSLAKDIQLVVRSGDTSSVDSAVKMMSVFLFQETYLPLCHVRPLIESQLVFMSQAALEAGAETDVVVPLSEDFLARAGTAYEYSLMMALLLEAAQAFTKTVRERFLCQSHRLVAAVDEYLNGCFTDPELDLQKIAAHIGASPTHISRTYKKIKQVGCRRRINQLRVNAAKRQLLDSSICITELGFTLGFGTLQHFGRAFKEETGVSPSEFRRQQLGQAQAERDG